MDVLGIWKADPDIPPSQPHWDDRRSAAVATVRQSDPDCAQYWGAGGATRPGRRRRFCRRWDMSYCSAHRATVSSRLFSPGSGNSNSTIWLKVGSSSPIYDSAGAEKFVHRPSPFKFCVVAGDQDEFVPRRSWLEPFQEVIPQQCFVIPGNHLSLVKPEAAERLALQLVLKTIIGEASAAGPGNAARVALEAREFHETIRLLEPNHDQLDRPALVQLALAYEGVGRQADAIYLLERNLATTDAIGVLAGRLEVAGGSRAAGSMPSAPVIFMPRPWSSP